jgi:hypothetical protein
MMWKGEKPPWGQEDYGMIEHTVTDICVCIQSQAKFDFDA